MKKISYAVCVILTLGVIFFGTINYFMVVNLTKEEISRFENKITELEKRISDENKENKISGIRELKAIEKEIDNFDKKIMLVIVNKDSFKNQSQKVKEKIEESIGNLTKLYKTKLDINVKTKNTMSKEELSVTIKNLDRLIREIRDDKILTEEQIKPFENKANEMKQQYTNEIEEIEKAEAKARIAQDNSYTEKQKPTQKSPNSNQNSPNGDEDTTNPWYKDGNRWKIN